MRPNSLLAPARPCTNYSPANSGNKSCAARLFAPEAIIQLEQRKVRLMSDFILHDHNDDGIDRRGFLKCMAWAGTGALFVLKGGVLESFAMSKMGQYDEKKLKGELSFVQISDSHIGFNKPANTDVLA